jgi:hypothetical protein
MKIYRMHRSARAAADYVWSRTELRPRPGSLQFANLNHIASCQAAGHSWVGADNELAVQVPSIVIPDEVNVLLNPNHACYRDLEWSEPLPFRFDPRLFMTEPQTL